ncbi:MAG: glycosyltransferase involved in cell wall biosynthesis [Pseudohongiellaceae bacterium]|jgi:glycosyltransferase involved in cell wall biosynthesis
MSPADSLSEKHAGLGSVFVVIPALDEERSVGLVLNDLPWELLGRVVVADNGSTDNTAAVAREAGATVVKASRRGYGSACLAGLAELGALAPNDVVVFLDADYSDHPHELPLLLAPILAGRAALVVGSRALGQAEPGSMLPQQRFGNALATFLIRLAFGHVYTDLGPFRAITGAALQQISMADPNWGWTVEMQVRVLQEGLAVTEVPVSYRRRVGRSKIAGTLRGTISAGVKILWTIARLRRLGPAHLPLSDQS